MNVEQWKAHYHGKTHTAPRPSKSHERFAKANEFEWAARDLEAAKQGYDLAKDGDDRTLQLRIDAVAKRAQGEADQRAKQREHEAEQRAASDARILAPARVAFLAAGGTQAEFDEATPEILKAARLQAAVKAATTQVDHDQPRSTMPQI